MRTAARFFCIVLPLALAACSNDKLPETAMMEKGRISFERNTSFDGEVLRIEFDRKDGGREQFSSVRDRWFGWSWVPFLPNHSGRRWALLKADREGTSIAYSIVSWDNDEPTDYLAAGYWLRFDGFHTRQGLPLAAAEITLFVDGPEIDSAFPPSLPISGTASYVGEAGGIYAYRYGSAWSGHDEPVAAEEFAGPMTVQANFDDMTVAGCIGCGGDLRIERLHLYPLFGYRAEEPLALPTDYEIRFASTPIRPAGNFESEAVTVSHPAREVTLSNGNWGGTFSSRPAADGNPSLVAGFASAGFEEADGSRGSFRSIFITPHPSVLPPPPASAPRP